MFSSFTWLDYSEHERRKMLDIVKLFTERETRDELGIGSVRDAFADLFFPGTSTIQTRARYFFFVPWMYLDLENKRGDAGKIADRARQREINLIKTLIAAGEGEGVIGRRAKDRLLRLPSNIYWQGLGVLGIRLFRGSQDQYHQLLAKPLAHMPEPRRQRGEEASDIRVKWNWHPGLPLAPSEFPNHIDFQLTQVEAEYLRERLQTYARDSLMAFWAGSKVPPPQSEFPWQVINKDYPEYICNQLEHAQNFSETIHGAALLYNLLLAEQTARTDWVDKYRSRLEEWIERTTARLPVLNRWDRTKFWDIVNRANPRVPGLTHLFVERWLKWVLDQGHISTIITDPFARDLIREREKSIKHGQARLQNRRALDQWNGSAGEGQLDFRWRVAQSHLQDIHKGLQVQ